MSSTRSGGALFIRCSPLPRADGARAALGGCESRTGRSLSQAGHSAHAMPMRAPPSYAPEQTCAREAATADSLLSDFAPDDRRCHPREIDALKRAARVCMHHEIAC